MALLGLLLGTVADATLVWTIITAGIASATLLVLLSGVFYRFATGWLSSRMLKDPFVVSHNPTTVEVPLGIDMPRGITEVRLEAKTTVHVERVLFQLRGNGPLPKMTSLYDPTLGTKTWSPSLYNPYPREPSGLYWHYKTPLPRAPKNTVRVVVEVEAVSDYFEGVLVVQPAVVERPEAQGLTELPIRIIRQQVPGTVDSPNR